MEIIYNSIEYFIGTYELVCEHIWWIAPFLIGLIIYYFFLYRGKYFFLILINDLKFNIEGPITFILIFYFIGYSFVLTATLLDMTGLFASVDSGWFVDLISFLSVLFFWAIFSIIFSLIIMSLGSYITSFVEQTNTFNAEYLKQEKLKRFKGKVVRHNEIHGFKYAGYMAYIIWFCLSSLTIWIYF